MGAAPQPYAACHCTSRAKLYLLQRHIFPKASEGHWIPVRDENGLPFFCFFKFHRITCPIQIPYNNEHIQRIRQIAGRRWESNAKRWIIPYTIATIQKFTNLFDSVHVQISPELRVESEALRDWNISGEPPKWKRDQLQQALKLRGYSRKTIKAYCSQIARFLASLPQVDTDISTSNVQTYCLSLLERGVYHSSVNQTISAIRFYCKHVLHHSADIQYIRPKKQIKLPNVMSEKEVAQLLKSVTNLKHKTILYLTYSAGLRVGEVVRLRFSDLDIERQTLIVRQGKGQKDRRTLLSSLAWEIVQNYIAAYRPNRWLFLGQSSDRHLTERSVQKVFEEARQRAGIVKKVSIHALKHSFATHLLENGTDLRYIQELLGHTSARTTQRYTDVTTKNIQRTQSPLDRMDMGD